MGSNGEKCILIEYQKIFRNFGAPIIFSMTVCKAMMHVLYFLSLSALLWKISLFKIKTVCL